MNEITFDPAKGPISVNVVMTGVAFISYQLTYWSDKKPQRKILMEMRGNNEQDHDDSCSLTNMDDPHESTENYANRSVTLQGFIRATGKDKTPYKIIVEFLQEGNVLNNDVLATEGELNKADGAKMYYEAGKFIKA